jgi:hypothetical protein
MSPEQIIEKWVAAARAGADTNNLEVGVNISTLPAVKIAFDGYAEDDDGIEDLDCESYAVYIHRNAAAPGFIFPEHQRTAWAIVQRPAEEACHIVWFNAAYGFFEGPSSADSCDPCGISPAEAERIVRCLAEMA